MRTLLMVGLGAIASLGSAACGSARSDLSETPARPTPQIATHEEAPSLDRSRLDRVSVLARGRPVDDAEWARWKHEDAEQVIDAMLHDPFLSDQVAVAIIFKNNVLRPAREIYPGGFHMQHMDAGGKKISFLTKKCAPDEAVSVHPWWDMSSTVWVCPSVINASVWKVKNKNGEVVSCAADDVGPIHMEGSPCGCGPNLIRCPPQEGAWRQVRSEVEDTTSFVVSNDLPLATLFSGEYTFRTKDVELLYRRENAVGMELSDPSDMMTIDEPWPKEGKWERLPEIEEGQYAGLLTSQQLVNHTFDPRQRMRIVYEALWCSAESAPGALPEDVLAIKSPNLSMSNVGWRELAGRPICTHCHARLDYGKQFFKGYLPPVTGGLMYKPGLSTGTGPLYGNHIRDPRGEAPLTPQGFASLAIKQPEFARCMAKDVAEYVLGPATTDAQIERLASSAPNDELRFRPLMKQALLELMNSKSPMVPAVATHEAAGRAVHSAPALSDLVEEHCTMCHMDGAKIPSFESEIPSDLRARALDQVLSGRMPPTGELPPDVRRQFLAAILPTLPGHAGDDASRAFLWQQSEPAAALPIVAARELVRRVADDATRSTPGQAEKKAAGASSDDAGKAPLNLIENALDGRHNTFTPNFAAITAMEAFQACRKRAGKDAKARKACTRTVLHRVWK